MAFIVQLKLIVGKPGSPRAGANARRYTLLVKGGHIVKIRDNIRTRVKHRVVFAALALFLVTGLVGGAIWIAAAPGEPGQPERYQWSAAEQVKRDQAIAQKDSSLLPVCTEDYFEWREETKAAREAAGITEPAKTDFWSAPGCRGIPDRLVEGPASESGPKAPTASGTNPNHASQ